MESYPSRRVSENSLLIVDITVNDVNDNPPKFQYPSYAVGVSEDDNPEKVLLTLLAFDPDLDDVISYHLLTDTIVATGDNLEGVKSSAFLVNQVTGALILNFKLQGSMKGFFEFEVQARDLVNHTDEVTVKIYLVAQASRVTFVFFNDLNTVRNVDQQRLSEIFGNAYEAQCVIDAVEGTIIDGAVSEDKTDVIVHFVRNSEALDASEILQLSLSISIPRILMRLSNYFRKSSDGAFITKLDAELRTLSLNLQALTKTVIENPESSNGNLLVIILSAVSGILLLLLGGTVAYSCIKKRSYDRQINVLTESNSGSNSTDLNRNINSLPNTNIFSNENSNPVMNNSNLANVDLDTLSIISSDSDDFAGLHDNKIFNLRSSADASDDIKNPLAQNNPKRLQQANSESGSSYI